MPRGNYQRQAFGPERDAALEALRAELADLRTQISSRASIEDMLARIVAAGDKPATISQQEAEAKAPPLEPVADERARILAAWDAEEKVLLSIAPDQNDERARLALQANAKRAGQDPEGVGYPPRTFQVNGVQLHIPVGELTHVPRSIADLYAYTLNPWKARGVTKPITFEQAETRMGLAV